MHADDGIPRNMKGQVVVVLHAHTHITAYCSQILSTPIAQVIACPCQLQRLRAWCLPAWWHAAHDEWLPCMVTQSKRIMDMPAASHDRIMPA